MSTELFTFDSLEHRNLEYLNLNDSTADWISSGIYLREDEQKVYYYLPESNDEREDEFRYYQKDLRLYFEGQESILYDFSLMVGDTFHMPPTGLRVTSDIGEYAVVRTVDTITLADGSVRKRWGYAPGITAVGEEARDVPSHFLIEGIGMTFSFFGTADLFTFDGLETQHLTCYKEDDIELFSNVICVPGFTTAVYDASGPSSQYTVFPNPTAGQVNISTTDNTVPHDITSITLMDATGKQLLTSLSPNPTVDLSDYPQGLYLLRIADGRGDWHTHKVIRR